MFKMEHITDGGFDDSYLNYPNEVIHLFII